MSIYFLIFTTIFVSIILIKTTYLKSCMEKLFFLFVFLFFIPLVHAETFINEIMYNPEGDDNNNEYIEIYTNESLENFTIEDLASSDILKLVKSSNSNFALIVEEDFNFSDIDANIYSAGKAIGNNLNNDRDVIVLKDKEGVLIDAISYFSENGGDGNGFSLCKLPDKIGKLTECFPSPGKINTNNVSYSIRINEFLPNPQGNDSSLMPQGEWIEIHNFGDIDIDLDGFKLEDNFGHDLFISDSQVIGSTIIKEHDYLVVYLNGKEGFLNNEDFDVIHLFDPNGNLIDTVSYDGSQEDVSWAFIDDKWFPSQPTPSINNPSLGEISLGSQIQIENIYLGVDEKVHWGDTFRIKLNIYRGNTSKEVVGAWIFKGDTVVSKRTTFNVHERFLQQEYTIPLQIDSNCNEKYSDGLYDLIVSGLDIEIKGKIIIEGLDSSFCKHHTVSREKDFMYEVLQAPQRVIVGKDFTILVKITNNFEVKKEFDVWSEVVDGTKVISKKGKQERVTSLLSGDSSIVITLNNSIDTFEEGGKYELNVKILEQGKKRSQSIKQTLEVVKEREDFFENNLNEDKKEISESIVYSSHGKKQRTFALYFFIFLVALMGIYGVVKK